jgi:hypothetical protein
MNEKDDDLTHLGIVSESEKTRDDGIGQRHVQMHGRRRQSGFLEQGVKR